MSVFGLMNMPTVEPSTQTHIAVVPPFPMPQRRTPPKEPGSKSRVPVTPPP